MTAIQTNTIKTANEALAVTQRHRLARKRWQGKPGILRPNVLSEWILWSEPQDDGYSDQYD